MLGRPTGKVQLEAMADSDSNSSTLTDLSSELSSAPASPKLPPLSMASYPTPSSSQTQSTYSSSSEQDSRKRRRKDAECPPMKRRKIVEPRERKVERLDLQPGSPETLLAQSLQLEILLKAIHKKRKIVVVAGAGISTSAGGRWSIDSLCRATANSTKYLTSALPTAYSILFEATAN